MAKKGLLVLILVFIMGTSAAASDFRFSMGFSGFFINDFGGGAEWESGKWRIADETPYAGGGGSFFFDFTWLELSFGYFGGGGNMKFVTDLGSSGHSQPVESLGYSLDGMDIGLMLKLPFGDDVKFFPFLGINYRGIFTLTYKDEYEYEYNEDENEYSEPWDFSALWIKLGVGLDIYPGYQDFLFFRFELAYGIRLKSQYDKDSNDLIKEYIKEYGIRNPDSTSSLSGTRLGHGLGIKIGLGLSI